MRGYRQPKPGEWIEPIRRGYRMMCCDCGLVHEMDFRVSCGVVQFRVYRHERATAAARRGKFARKPRKRKSLRRR